MKKILTCNQMKALDENTICGMRIPSAVLMERAALAVADQIRELPGEYPLVLVVCGSGNNGGAGHCKAFAASGDKYRYLSGRRSQKNDTRDS